MKNFYNRLSNSEGNVIVEFTLTAVALFVPIAYLASAGTQVATNYLEVQDAARAGARVFASSTNEASGKYLATQAALITAGNSDQVTIKISCSASPCLTLNEVIKVEVQKRIELNLPDFLGLPTVNLTGAQSEIVQAIQ